MIFVSVGLSWSRCFSARSVMQTSRGPQAGRLLIFNRYRQVGKSVCLMGNYHRQAIYVHTHCTHALVGMRSQMHRPSCRRLLTRIAWTDLTGVPSYIPAIAHTDMDGVTLQMSHLSFRPKLTYMRGVRSRTSRHIPADPHDSCTVCTTARQNSTHLVRVVRCIGTTSPTSLIRSGWGYVQVCI